MRILLLAVAILSISADPGPDVKDGYVDKEAATKLLIAYGPDHKEVKAAKFKFQVKGSKGSAWVFACDKFEVLADGRVKLTPYFAARFYDKENQKKTGRPGCRVEGGSSVFKMDKVVKKAADMNGATFKEMVLDRALYRDFAEP